jgi:hypothetical protein
VIHEPNAPATSSLMVAERIASAAVDTAVCVPSAICRMAVRLFAAACAITATWSAVLSASGTYTWPQSRFPPNASRPACSAPAAVMSSTPTTYARDRPARNESYTVSYRPGLSMSRTPNRVLNCPGELTSCGVEDAPLVTCPTRNAVPVLMLATGERAAAPEVARV